MLLLLALIKVSGLESGRSQAHFKPTRSRLDAKYGFVQVSASESGIANP